MPAKIWRTKTIEDRRGTSKQVVDETTPPHEVTVWTMPERSSRAELPGQQEIDIVRIGCKADLSGVTLFSRVEWRGEMWDVVTPPAYHHGTRHTRHWSIKLRQRPS